MSNYARSRTRKFLYQKLYAQSFSKVEDDNFKEAFFAWVFQGELDEEYLNTMFDLIIKNENFLIEVVKKYAPRFDIENMDLSYIIPIFIWTAELFLLTEEIPAKVSINEAIEISKMYWDDSSRKMVNWVLNKVLVDIEELKTFQKTITEETKNQTIFKK